MPQEESTKSHPGNGSGEVPKKESPKANAIPSLDNSEPSEDKQQDGWTQMYGPGQARVPWNDTVDSEGKDDISTPIVRNDYKSIIEDSIKAQGDVETALKIQIERCLAIHQFDIGDALKIYIDLKEQKEQLPKLMRKRNKRAITNALAHCGFSDNLAALHKDLQKVGNGPDQKPKSFAGTAQSTR